VPFEFQVGEHLSAKLHIALQQRLLGFGERASTGALFCC
jgi:hypothetical protein